MNFALNPDDAPPRLIRYVDDLPPGVIATLDTQHNLLRIQRNLYQQLTPMQQAGLIRTMQPMVLAE